ncbi:hypothetical protein D9756_006543 [Leucocoprinus leucothites]|uniref:F-box domain-containing protein n=1 Tax=Leucocoprinus leucothites TaxID=201217 RepID=A0A8H5G2B4_9AGAR|nr:hypothetical protein D9756_006543 [Leucoagaricus leucothites]
MLRSYFANVRRHEASIAAAEYARRKLDAANSPINLLPLEILVAIFRYATFTSPPLNYSDSWEKRPSLFSTWKSEDIFFSITLGAVCSHWREVALSTPLLWTSFKYPLSLWEAKKASRHLLSLYLQNSKHLPIHLSLSFPEVFAENDYWHPSVDHVLMFNSARIQSLSILSPPLRWFSFLNSMPSLVNLSIDWEGDPPYTTNRLPLQKCHSLSRFSLNGSQHGNPRIIYQVPPSLTILDLSFVPVDHSIKVMLRCPSLVEAYIHEQYNADGPQDREWVKKWFTRPVVFPCLKIFLWNRLAHNNSEWANIFFEHLRTPVLETLIFTENQGQVWDYLTDELSFMGHLPPTLKTLKFVGIEYINFDELEFLLGHNSPIENFSACRCELRVLTGIFQALLPPSDAPELTRMPRLKSLSVDGCRSGRAAGWELGPRVFEPLITVLERRLARGSTFRLELSGGVDWTPDAQARLQGLVENGIQLEIVEDMEPVHWLKSN